MLLLVLVILLHLHLHAPLHKCQEPQVVSAAGTVTAVSIANSGFGYQAGTTFAAAAGGDEAFRATGITTMRYNSIFAEGTQGLDLHLLCNPRWYIG